jgi:hypothetical protein
MCVCCWLFAPLCEFPKLSGYNHCVFSFFLKKNLFPFFILYTLYEAAVAGPARFGRPEGRKKKQSRAQQPTQYFLFFYMKIT